MDIIPRLALWLDTQISFTIGSLLKWLFITYVLFFPFCYIITCIKHKEFVKVDKKYLLHSWFLSPFLMIKEWIMLWWEAL